MPTGGHVDTVGPPDERHTDVSLWFVLTGQREQVLQPDHVEFHSVRWWSGSEVTASDPSLFDPHLARMLTKVHQILRTP